jgi:hypothetical protein
MISRNFPDPENPYIFRATQDGDLFILLAPTNEVLPLLRHQKELQSLCYGSIPSPVHVTVQRFEDQDGACFQKLVDELHAKLCDFQSFPIHAVSFRSLFSSYQQAFLLKWVAEMSEPLHSFSALVEATLHTCGYKSLYQPGWISTWITALEGIDCSRLPVHMDEFEIPSPLFIGSQVIISRINGKNDYTYLDQFPLSTRL